MTDGGEILGDGLEKFIERADKALSLQGRKKVNRAGAKVYKKNMEAFTNAHRSNRVYLTGQQHLADTVTTKTDASIGEVSIGFSKAGKKGYIARLLNDGWESYNQFGGPYGRIQPPEWHDFFTRIGEQSQQGMKSAMVREIEKQLRKKG